MLYDSAQEQVDPRSVQLRVENQRNQVADEVSAITAVVRPILEGLFYGLREEFVATVEGGRAALPLKTMGRLYRPGDGDVGICFEWAVHDAMNRKDHRVLDRVSGALKLCRVPGSSHESILFGAEKRGALNLIETARDRLTDDSRVLTGAKAQPPKLKAYIYQLARALRRQSARAGLPFSISGLWKADLFLGTTDADRWVGTTVKINPAGLEAAPGLRIGIVPMQDGASDLVKIDDQRNLVICPLPHDASFMQTFYEAWQVVKLFIDADCKVPSLVALPRASFRQVAKYLEDRRDFPVLDVIEVLKPLSQPELLETEMRNAEIVAQREAAVRVDTVIAPRPRIS